MNTAQEAYDRLMAARRFVTPQEREEMDKNRARDELKLRIRRKHPKVY